MMLSSYRTLMVMCRDSEWVHAKSPDREQRDGTFVYVYTARFGSLTGCWW